MSTSITRIVEDLLSQSGLQGKGIADLRYVMERLSDFYTPDEAQLWLNSRHLLLNDQRAIDLINADRTEEVLGVIERLNFGAYI
jgi:uncharacterized protein (DUF2384 family)